MQRFAINLSFQEMLQDIGQTWMPIDRRNETLLRSMFRTE